MGNQIETIVPNLERAVWRVPCTEGREEGWLRVDVVNNHVGASFLQIARDDIDPKEPQVRWHCTLQAMDKSVQVCVPRAHVAESAFEL